MTFPYLTRVLNVNGFGYLAFATAIITYSMIFCQYGFDLTATAKIAKIRNNKKYLNRYSSAIYLSKILLCLFSIITSSLFLWLKGDIQLTILTLSMLSMPLGMLITPTWLFQGLELMKELTLFTVISRISTLPLLFIFVKDSDDIYLAGFFQSLPFLITSFFCIYYMVKNNVIKFEMVSYKYVRNVIGSGWDVFVTTISSSVYMSLFPIVLGFLHGPTSVGYFSVVQNIKNICLSCFEPIYQVVFPRVNSLIKSSPDVAKEILRRYFFISFIFLMLGIMFVVFFNEEIIKIIAGEQYLQVKQAMVMMMIAVFFSVINNFYGVQTLISSGYSYVLKNIVFSASIICLLMIFPIVYYYDYLGSVLLLVFIEFIVFVLLRYYHYKLNLKLLF